MTTWSKKHKISYEYFIILEAPLLNASSAQGFLKSQQIEELNKLKLYAGYSRNRGSCMACFRFFIINFNFKLINNGKNVCWKRTQLIKNNNGKNVRWERTQLIKNNNGKNISWKRTQLIKNILSFLKLLCWMPARPKVSWNPNRSRSSINWSSTLGIQETEGLAYAYVRHALFSSFKSTFWRFKFGSLQLCNVKMIKLLGPVRKICYLLFSYMFFYLF